MEKKPQNTRERHPCHSEQVPIKMTNPSHFNAKPVPVMAPFPLPPIKPLPAFAPYGISVSPILYLHCTSECFPLRNHQIIRERKQICRKLLSTSLDLPKTLATAEEATRNWSRSQAASLTFTHSLGVCTAPSNSKQDLPIFQVSHQGASH